MSEKPSTAQTFEEWFPAWRANHPAYFESVDWRLHEHLVKIGWEYAESALLAARTVAPKDANAK